MQLPCLLMVAGGLVALDRRTSELVMEEDALLFSACHLRPCSQYSLRPRSSLSTHHRSPTAELALSSPYISHYCYISLSCMLDWIHICHCRHLTRSGKANSLQYCRPLKHLFLALVEAGTSASRL